MTGENMACLGAQSIKEADHTVVMLQIDLFSGGENSTTGLGGSSKWSRSDS